MIYRPLNTDLSLFINEIENVIKSLTTTKTNLILAGDYNIKLLNHEIHSETGNCLNILSANAMERYTDYNKANAICGTLCNIN